MERRGGDKGINSERKRRNRWQNARSHQRNRRVSRCLKLPSLRRRNPRFADFARWIIFFCREEKLRFFQRRKERGVVAERKKVSECEIALLLHGSFVESQWTTGKISRLLAERREFIFACWMMVFNAISSITGLNSCWSPRATTLLRSNRSARLLSLRLIEQVSFRAERATGVHMYIYIRGGRGRGWICISNYFKQNSFPRSTASNDQCAKLHNKSHAPLHTHFGLAGINRRFAIKCANVVAHSFLEILC